MTREQAERLRIMARNGLNRRRSDPNHAPDEAPPRETPYQHLANAVQSLFLAEARVAELMVAELMMPPDQLLVDLIQSAEARCFHAIFEIGREDKP